MTPNRRILAGVLIMVTALPCAAVAQSDSQADSRTLDNLVENIIGLRADVEGLDANLQRLESAHEAKMSSLARREGELAAQGERRELNISQLERKLADLNRQTRKAGVATRKLDPVLRKAVGLLRAHIETSLPFTRGERLAALSKLRTQLETGAVDSPRLANHLWSFYADELRLTGNSGLYRQPILIEGQQRLADVARLGMMSLYFRADDGRFGYAAHAGDGWSFRYLDGAPADEVAALFGSLRQRLSTGFFLLPYPISEAAVASAGRQPLRQARAAP